jgi:hypothetical protein
MNDIREISNLSIERNSDKGKIRLKKPDGTGKEKREKSCHKQN